MSYYDRPPRVNWQEVLIMWFTVLSLIVLPILVGLGIYTLIRWVMR